MGVRAVLAHSRRAATDPHSSEEEHARASTTMASTWLSMHNSRTLPRPVKEWATKGFEFTDGGLGIGDRFDMDFAKRSPGPAEYSCRGYGDIARYNSESSMPTKQADARHQSAEAHKMGARRDTGKKADRQRPGPGTYELKGFADEILAKAARRPQPRDENASDANTTRGRVDGEAS